MGEGWRVAEGLTEGILARERHWERTRERELAASRRVIFIVASCFSPPPPLPV